MATRENEPGRKRADRWRWVGADPDDRSPDADFRRRIAALAREVMLAHGADPATLPPPPADAAAGSVRSADAGAQPRHEPDPDVGPPSPEYFDLRPTTAYAIDLAARTLQASVRGPAGVQEWSPPAQMLLLAIARSPAGTSTRDLSRVLDLASSTQSNFVTRLVEEGLVTRRQMASDRRSSVLTATASGRREAERVAATWRRTDRSLLAGLSTSEREELGRLLRRATAALVARPGSR